MATCRTPRSGAQACQFIDGEGRSGQDPQGVSAAGGAAVPRYLATAQEESGQKKSRMRLRLSVE